MTATVETPVVVPTRVAVSRRGVRTVEIICPFCRRRHSHGWPLSHAQPGLRVAHCGGPNGSRGSYYIEAPKAVTPR